MKLEELGRRAVACPRWRWLPGMRITQNFSPLGWRLHALNGSEEWRAEDVRGTKLPTHPGEPWLYPDFSDPATLGCLLHLVREATGQQSSASWYPGGKHDYPHWAWYSDDCYGKLCEGSTEAECLVKVLEYMQ